MTPFYTNAATLIRTRLISQPALADRLGWEGRRLRRVLNGETRLLVNDAMEMAQALRVDPAALLFMEPKRFEEVIRVSC